MQGRREHWEDKKARGENRYAPDWETVSCKVLNTEKEDFFRICYEASQKSGWWITPSKVVRAFIEAVNISESLSPEIVKEVGRLQQEEDDFKRAKKEKLEWRKRIKGNKQKE